MTDKTRLPQSKSERRKARRKSIRDKKLYYKRETKLASSISQLERHKDNLNEKEQAAAESLINHFMNGSMSLAQKSYVKGLAKRAVPRNGPASVYLITESDCIKIGISKNPERRMKDLQVSNANPLTLLSTTLYKTRGQANLAEKRLHKACKRFKVSGEWFRWKRCPCAMKC